MKAVRVAILCILICPNAGWGGVRLGDIPLTTEEREERWRRWELAGAVLLIAGGAVLAARNDRVGYALSFSSAAGLLVHFSWNIRVK
ncbi:MAG: hypothetical protein HYZ73_08510 [Elusimicrobia bacterium]|nr:hypothetical protein [Elusimicrobiota bacterium]